MTKIIEKTVVDKYAPHNTNVDWLDVSGDNPVKKSYINGKWQVIGGGGGSEVSYPNFSESETYYVGDRVTYNNKLYEFTETHEAGAWDETQVKEVSSTDILDTSKMVEIHWKDLVDLRDNAKLVPGTWYRIIDYVTKVNSKDINKYKSAEHPFDIIVLALSKDTLSENAKAIQHKDDEYFKESNLNTWRLKYRLDNDETFSWCKYKQPAYVELWDGYEVATRLLDDYSVEIDGKTYYLFEPEGFSNYYYGFDKPLPNVGDTVFCINLDKQSIRYIEEESVTYVEDDILEEGTGVIYQMEDEYNNVAPFDFKNLQFLRYRGTYKYTFTQSGRTITSYYSNYYIYHQPSPTSTIPTDGSNEITAHFDDYKYMYLFSCFPTYYTDTTSDVEALDASVSNVSLYHYINNGCKNNTIQFNSVNLNGQINLYNNLVLVQKLLNGEINNNTITTSTGTICGHQLTLNTIENSEIEIGSEVGFYNNKINCSSQVYLYGSFYLYKVNIKNSVIKGIFSNINIPNTRVQTLDLENCENIIFNISNCRPALNLKSCINLNLSYSPSTSQTEFNLNLTNLHYATLNNCNYLYNIGYVIGSSSNPFILENIGSSTQPIFIAQKSDRTLVTGTIDNLIN